LSNIEEEKDIFLKGTNKRRLDMKRTLFTALARSPGRLWLANAFKAKLSLVMGATLLLFLQLCGPAFATITDPEYTSPLLDPATQPRWVNAIPNALMAAFTFTPYTQAAALTAGFPAGANCGVVGPTGEDCYTIEVRQVQQNLGLVDEVTGLPLSTAVFGYGSSTNAPAVGPFVGGVWHAPAPTFRNTSNRPTRITWVNKLPNVRPPGHDPTYDGGPNAPNNYPYNRIVTHVHGAHVNSDSDGNPEQWYTPGFTLTGVVYKPSPYGPLGTFRYGNTQEAATVWYHDHATGLTHTNTQMGLAGFYLITDANEAALQAGTLTPGGVGATRVLPTDPYEVGFALQDRTFWPDGSIAMPDQPVRNLLAPTCQTDVTGAVIPTTCPLVNFSKAPDGHLIPYDPLLADTAQRGPYSATNGTLEYFGNMPMVNGVVYGKYDVEPRVYRMRFIGGTDSRTWEMQLVRRDTLAVIPFWQIGTEQGLLANPVQRTSIDLMPGERIDVLVDLKNIPVGTKIVMKNLGPDIPYQGPAPFVAPLPPSTVIPEIMEFNVIALGPTGDVAQPSALTNLRPVSGAIAPLTVTVPVRNVSLIEQTDTLGRVLPTIDGRGYMMTIGTPVTEKNTLNDVEQWDIINTTADAHPMHLHLVSFQVVNRQQFINFLPPVTDTLNGLFQQPFYTPTGAVQAPFPWEAGWKDTIDCPPGWVTRVKARYDIAGLYLWHCHILSHEEHDMMRPFVVSSAPSYTITAAAGANGTVAGSQLDGIRTTAVAAGSATVVPGSVVTYTFTPNPGFELDSIVVDGVVIQSAALTPRNSYKFVDIQANHYINAYFRAAPNTITLGIGAGGTVTGGVAGVNTVATGATVTYTFNPSPGNEVSGIVVDGVTTPSTALAPILNYTFTNVAASHYLNVYFRPIPNVITVTIAGVGINAVKNGTGPGAVSVVGANLVTTGGTLDLAFVPAAGNHVSGIVVDGVYTPADPAAPLLGYSFTGVTGNHYINVYFVPIPALQSFNIAAASNNAAFGTITAAAPALPAPGPYTQGSTVVFNITPAALHTLLGVVVDGTYLPGPRTSFTFTNLQADHYINAYFQ
jgi:spore coat protein A